MGGLRSSAYVTEVITEAPPPSGGRQRAAAGGLGTVNCRCHGNDGAASPVWPAASKLVLSVGAREAGRPRRHRTLAGLIAIAEMGRS